MHYFIGLVFFKYTALYFYLIVRFSNTVLLQIKGCNAVVHLVCLIHGKSENTSS